MARRGIKPTRNTWTEFRATLESRHFWALMGWTALILGVAGLLLWWAVKNWDTAMSARAMVCRRGGDTDAYILVLALIAPFFGISMLGAISELWHNLERHRKHITRHWRPFWVFTVLVAVLGALILEILNC